MKKITVALLILIVPTFFLYSQNSTLYMNTSSAVLYIQHEIRLNAELCRNPDTVRKLEKIIGKNILDEYVPLLTGSGFFIDDDGTFLTNRHVIQVPFINSMRSMIAVEFTNEISERYGGKFSIDELNTLLDDLSEMVKKGEYRLSAAIGDEVFNDITILRIAKDSLPDLAVARINDEQKFAVLKLSDLQTSQNLVGTDVYSFGFPLGPVFDRIFNERVVTMNKGAVSAVRKAELSIQHTAAISPGNSGGPLTDQAGTVVGINTALFSEGDSSSLFYAISAEQITGFLENEGYENLLKWNRRVADKAAGDDVLKLNVLGEFETSADLIIDAEKGLEIYIDGELKGTSPLYLQLDKPLSELMVTGMPGEFSVNLRVLSTLSGTTTMRPSLRTKSSLVKFAGDPGVEIFADGKLIGKTPAELELPADEYLFSFSKPGYYYEPVAFAADSAADNEVLIKSRPAYRINIEGIPAQKEVALSDYVFGKSLSIDEKLVRIIFNSNEKKLVYAPGDSIFLPEGLWFLSVDGVFEYTGMKIPITVSGRDLNIDVTQYLPHSALSFRDLPEGARIWIDGQETEVSPDARMNLPLGKREVFIWKDGYQPMSTDVTVRPDGRAFINWQEYTGHQAGAWVYTSIGVLSAGTGTAFMLVGSLFLDNDYALQHSQNYQEYLDIKNLGFAGFVAGSILSAGGVLLIPAIIEWIEYADDLKSLKLMENGKQ